MAAEVHTAAVERGMMYDLLIKEARIVDGTGAPFFSGDLGVIGDHIAQVGRLKGKARRVVAAAGQVLAPGFIDIHSHSDSAYLVNPLGESKVRQGVTTEVMGQCGFSLAPVSGLAVDELQKELREYGLELSWRRMGEYLERLREVRPAVNLATVVGHGTIRGSVMSHEPRPPTGEELERMRRLLRDALAEGAFGLSTGLIYPPGAFAQTEELVALARELAPFGGIYFTHMRNEGDRLLEAIGEAVRIGEEAGVPVEIAHLKVGGEKNWGKGKEALSAIWEARGRGVDVTCDQYPYTATSTGLSSILPRWAHAGGPEQLLARLQDPETRACLAAECVPSQDAWSGWERVLISSVKTETNKKWEGKNLAEIAQGRAQTPIEAAFDLLVEEELKVDMIRFGLSEDDVRTIMRHPWVMVGSDGSALAPYGILGKGKPHPRNYGTFPRVLGHYVREEGVLGLETAVSKMTGLPAWRLGLWDRGLLRPGFWADLVLFDPERIRDMATFADPHRYPEGIELVVVNGVVTVEGGEHTGARAGQVLLHS
jgi:N-acyl-D-amino-acid deacylase